MQNQDKQTKSDKKLKEKGKARYMQGWDSDEEDEYVFTVKSMSQPEKVEVIVGVLWKWWLIRGRALML